MTLSTLFQLFIFYLLSLKLRTRLVDFLAFNKVDII